MSYQNQKGLHEAPELDHIWMEPQIGPKYIFMSPWLKELNLVSTPTGKANLSNCILLSMHPLWSRRQRSMTSVLIKCRCSIITIVTKDYSLQKIRYLPWFHSRLYIPPVRSNLFPGQSCGEWFFFLLAWVIVACYLHSCIAYISILHPLVYLIMKFVTLRLFHLFGLIVIPRATR